MNRSRRNPNSYSTGFNQGAENNFNTRQYQQSPGNQGNMHQQAPGTPRPPKCQPLATPSPTPTPTPTQATPLKPALKPILKKEVKQPPSPVVEAEIKPEEIQTEEVPEIDMKPEKFLIADEISHCESLESLETGEENGGKPRKPFFKKIFGGVRKKPSIRAKERKIRQNRHLRKVILPKNALMALYEVKGIQIGDFIINTNMEGGFTALVTVNNCQYEGTGNSKGNAKTNACEKALRDYIIKKMMQKPRGISLSEPMETGESNDTTNGEESNLDETDDVPMVNLASYALYKLFTAWESEGFHVPEFHTAAPPATNQLIPESIPTKKPIGRNELPPNWEIMHPATLLCIMRPRLTYTDCGNNGDPANPIQTVKVIVDDQQFVGTGRSKKMARKNVAIAVCNSLFGTNFQVDE